MADDSVCPITLEPVASLRNPVVFKSDIDQRVVFELDALLEWLDKKRTHPITRQPIAIQRGFLVPVAWCDPQATDRKIYNFVQSSERKRWIAYGVFTAYNTLGWMVAFVANDKSTDAGVSIAINVISIFIGCGCCVFAYKNGIFLAFICIGSFFILALTSAMAGGWFEIDQIVGICSLLLLAVATLINTVRCCCRRLDDF